MSKDDNIFYKVHYSSTTISFWETCRDLQAVLAFLKEREDRLFGVEITIRQKIGWDEVERAELNRLKEKYEPNSPKVIN